MNKPKVIKAINMNIKLVINVIFNDVMNNDKINDIRNDDIANIDDDYIDNL